MSDDVVIKEREKSERAKLLGRQKASWMEKISPFIRFHVSFFCPNTSHAKFVLIPRLGDETVIHLKYITGFP